MCRSRPLAPCLLIALFCGAAADAQQLRPDLGDRMPCDTWVALSDSTQSGVTILAKNSDRPLFDCQPLEFHARRSWADGAEVDLGRLKVPQVDETYASMGSSPYWCWGYEEGINEFGVAIGNEGIWDKVLVEQLQDHVRGEGPVAGPTGMDLMRLGLERAQTAQEALEVMTELLEEYGQFGSGIPTAPAQVGGYDNSFIIADPDEAWVLETAGSHWVARRFTGGTTSISNVPSIGADFDEISIDLVDTAVARGWWPEERALAFDFLAAMGAESPSNPGSGLRAVTRAECSARLLMEQAGAVTPRGMMDIARDRSSEPSIDLDQTASSCVAVLTHQDDAPPVFWWTPAVPSSGCYVPFFVHGSGLPELITRAGPAGTRTVAPSRSPPDRFSEDSYWWRFRELGDLVRRDYDERMPLVRAAFDPLEADFEAGLADVVAEAAAMRRDGHVEEAARLLDAYTAHCFERVLPVLDELRAKLRAAVGEVPPELAPFVGRYLSQPDRQPVSVIAKEGALALELPQGVFELREPDDEEWRLFVATDQAAIRFDTDADGSVVGMELRQGTMIIGFDREGIGAKGS